MQSPFYSEFRLGCCADTRVCYVCTRDATSVYPSVSTRFSAPRIRNGLSPLRRLARAANLSLLPARHPILLSSPSLPPRSHSVLSRRSTTRGCIESHRCTCTGCTTSHEYRLDQFTLGALLWRIHTVKSGNRKTHAHTDVRHSRFVGKLLLSRESQDDNLSLRFMKEKKINFPS